MKSKKEEKKHDRICAVLKIESAHHRSLPPRNHVERQGWGSHAVPSGENVHGL